MMKAILFGSSPFSRVPKINEERRQICQDFACLRRLKIQEAVQSQAKIVNNNHSFESCVSFVKSALWLCKHRYAFFGPFKFDQIKTRTGNE